MPSVSLWLGCYVTRRPRADGTFRVLFEVPRRLRPSDWPSQIKLPQKGFRRPDGEPIGDLSNLAEVDAIRRDAAALKAALDSRRNGQTRAPAPIEVAAGKVGTLPWLVVKWGGRRLLDALQGRVAAIDAATDIGPLVDAGAPEGASEAWATIEASSRQSYIVALRPVLAWSITIGHAHVSAMTPPQVRDFLDMWKDRPGRRKNIRGALSQLLSIAMQEGELAKGNNPLEAIRAVKRKRVKGGRRARVERWTRDDVDHYAETAKTVEAWRNGRGGRAALTWPGGAILVRLMYETAADSMDCIVWTRDHIVRRAFEGRLYDGIEFDRGKTGVPTFVPISDDLMRDIRAAGALYLVTDPQGVPYRKVIDDRRLRGHMETLRDYAVASGGRRLIFDHLRHSAATEANEMGVDLDDVRHLTAHTDSSMNRAVYVQRSAVKTVEIQKKRGLID